MLQVKIDYSNPKPLLELLAAMNLVEGTEIIVEKQEDGILLKPAEKVIESNILSKRELSKKWISQNREAYQGKWVVLDGDKVISVGLNSREVCEEAKNKGIETPFLVKIEPINSLPFGGW